MMVTFSRTHFPSGPKSASTVNSRKLEYSETRTSFYVEQICWSLEPTKPFQAKKNLYNVNTQNLEHLGRSNRFVGPLNEFLSLTRTFPYLSKFFQ